MPPQREVINEFIDLVWERGRPRIYVAGRPFLSCSFLVVKIDPTDPANEGATVEQLAERPGASILEGQDAAGTTIDGYTLSEADVMFGFKSSLLGWVENDYKTEALGANLSFPLLKELARVGDKKAQRVLQSEVIERLKQGHPNTTIVVLETCMDMIDADTTAWIIKNIIDPELNDIHSQKLNSFAAISELSTPLAIALLYSKDVHVRKEAVWHIKRMREFISKQEKHAFFDVLRHETNPGVIREVVELVDDPDVSAMIIDTLVKQARMFTADNNLMAIDNYDALDMVVSSSVTSPEILAKVVDFARFKSHVDAEDALEMHGFRSHNYPGNESRFHKEMYGFRSFDRRSKLIISALQTHKAPVAAIEHAITSLEKTETIEEELSISHNYPGNESRFLFNAIRSLRRSITAEPEAGPLIMSLKATYVGHYGDVHYRRETNGWKVWGKTGAASAPMARIQFEELFINDHEFDEYLRYTNMKKSEHAPEALVGMYTITLWSGTWKSLQDFAEKQGMKMGRAPFVVPLLAYRIYESVYFKDGSVFRLDEHCTPASRLWSRTGSDESGHQWKPVSVSKKLADYIR